MLLVVNHQYCVIIAHRPQTKSMFDMDNHKIQALKSHQDKLQADLDDVQGQIQQLAAEQEVIELQLAAVEKDLSQKNASSTFFTAKKLNGQLSLKGMTFREAVRTIIKNSDRSLRPKEITSKLQNSDFEYTGKVDLYLRVGNELGNLKKTGKIRSHKSLYRLAQEGG